LNEAVADTRQGLDLDPIDADEMIDTVHHIYELPAAAVERARELLPGM
jgi:hypothetical protein